MKIVILAGVLASLSAATAMAADDWSGNRLNVPRDQWLNASQVVEKLSSQGYKVIKIETDDGAYEADVTDKNGVYMEIHVHPATGELLVGYDD